MAQEPLIFHIDVNSAFLSWEAVSRLKESEEAEDLRLIPSAVGGDAASRRGVVLAKSTPAKQYGVITGEPLVHALRKCPFLTVVPSRFDLYLKYSSLLMELLSDYTPDIEKFSIDEAFLDMTATIHLFGRPLAAANKIRERIHKELGFTVNIGIAPNKLLAKMASNFQKPDLCHTLFPGEIHDKLWPLPIRELFFVGRSAQKKLEGVGIHTIGQLAACDVELLKPLLGEKYAIAIHGYARGRDLSPVEAGKPVNKGYSNSITLPYDIDRLEEAFPVLLSLCETVGARLRAGRVSCCQICVELKDWEFHTRSHQAVLPAPTDSTTVLYGHACRLLTEAWKGVPIRLLGVRASRIDDSGFRQLSLFETKKAQKMREMEMAVDRIRSKFGADSIKRASFLKPDAIVDHAAGKKKHLVSGTEKEDEKNH